MREGISTARVYTAAYLAELAISNCWRLVRFDQDFKHFGALQRLTLRSGGSSDQPTLIQLSPSLKFRILMQQRCLAVESEWDALLLEASSSKGSVWSTHWIGRDCNCS